jgi:quinoprotein glucose dehydrogenase
MWGITPLDQMVCRIRFRQARFEGTMTPPGLKPWIAAPGYVGGMDWGGASIDADDGVMIVNSARLVNYDRLLTRPQARVAGLKPVGANAPVMEVGRSVPQWGTPYGAQIAPFMSALGIPCQQPPYGFISAVDLVSGKLVWSRPLGTAKDTGPLGIRLGLPLVVGTPNIGGSVTTRSGVAFIGASADRTFRAFDIRSGRELWHANLPRGAFANPMTYLSPSSGRQFVVVAVGGKHGLGETDGAELWAFALPAHPLNGKRGS